MTVENFILRHIEIFNYRVKNQEIVVTFVKYVENITLVPPPPPTPRELQENYLQA